MSLIIAALIVLASAPPAVSTSAAAAGRENFSRPTLVASPCGRPPVWHERVFEDEDYLFVYRHYGKTEYVPGFFAYGKRYDRWLEISKLSTEHARLGHSPPFEEAKLSVSWDHSGLREREYAELPLRTSGSISFPSEIEFDAGRAAYRLNFNPSLKPEFQTHFWILKKDLEEAFAGAGR